MHTLGKLSALRLAGACVLAGAGLVQACGSEPLGEGSRPGNSSAGTGGASGRGGEGGLAAAAGTSGGRGGNDAGRGGGGNACIPEPAEDPLAHCPHSGQPTSNCPFEQTCVALRCGQVGSQFDASGCRRQECQSDGDCGADERCMAPPLHGVFELCSSSVYESVVNECDTCSVSTSADCGTPAFCESREEYPPADDCPIAGLGCNGLFVAQASVLGYLEQWDEDSELFAALSQCHDRIRDAREACSPSASGGAGGEGGQGGEASR